MPTWPRRAIDGAAMLLGDFDAFPEGDVVLDVLGVVLGVGVEPRRVGIVLSIYTHGVIAGLAFPASGGVGLGLHQVLALDRVRREVVVAFDFDGLVALRQDGAIPHSFCHG